MHDDVLIQTILSDSVESFWEHVKVTSKNFQLDGHFRGTFQFRYDVIALVLIVAALVSDLFLSMLC